MPVKKVESKSVYGHVLATASAERGVAFPFLTYNVIVEENPRFLKTTPPLVSENYPAARAISC